MTNPPMTSCIEKSVLELWGWLLWQATQEGLTARSA